MSPRREARRRVPGVGLAALGVGLLLGGVATTAIAASVVAAPRAPQPIIGGVPTEDGELDAVVAFRNSLDKLCSGTLIAPRLILTAAHCLVEHRIDQPVVVSFGSDTAGRTMLSRVFGVHPQFCDRCTVEAYDFAYIVLPEDYEPADGYLIPITDQQEWDETMGVDEVVLLAGFGTDDVDDDTLHAVQHKQKVSTTIRSFSDHGVEFFAGGNLRDTCFGDSGGPAIVQLGSGARRLAGVTSRGSNPCGNGGWYGVPFAALSWLSTETGVELLPPGCTGGSCLDTVPADPEEGCCFVGGRHRPPPPVLLLVPLLVRRRRRATERHASAPGR